MSSECPAARRSNVLFTLVLGLVLGLSPAMVRAGDDEDYQKLAAKARSAYRAAEYKKALELSEKMHELRPKALDPMYNIACLNCLLGEKEEAYEWLEKVVDAGWTDDDQMANDWDLRTIRGEARFRALLRKVRERGRGEADEPKRERPRDKKTEDESEDKPAKDDKAKKSDDETQDEDKQEKRELTAAEKQRKVNELTQKVIQASEAGEREKALKLALEALEVADIGLTNYNVACMHSLLGHKDEAFKYLDRAIDKGMGGTDMVGQIEGDEDFDKIRKDPRYAKALARAKEKSGGEREQGRAIQPKFKVTLPKGHDQDKKAPLIVALHGMGENLEEATDRWKKAADQVGAILLTPQGTLDQGDGKISWGRNLNQIEDNVIKAIDEVMDEYEIDEDRIVLAGFSQGGSLVYPLALRNPDTFCGIIPVAGRFAAESEGAFENAALKKMRVYIMVGEEDREELLEANKDAAKKFEKAGAKVKLNEFEGVGHDFPTAAVKEQVKALKWVLGE